MKKLLIWDADDTLWSGSIMEGTITITSDRLKTCRKLYERGVIQCIASHNNKEEVEKQLHIFGLSNFFLVVEADFKRSKGEMIRSIMKKLNIVKPEDVVFLDDNSTNIYSAVMLINGIGAYAPSVSVDDYLLNGEFRDEGNLTTEDRQRVEMYRSELARVSSGQKMDGTKMEFLESLKMECLIRPATLFELTRCQNLTSRANQMCASKEEYTPDDITKFIVNGELLVLLCADDYGDYGLSGVIRLCNNEISLLVISCRLQGKGYGSAFLGSVINKNPFLSVAWQRTQYNEGVGSLLDWYNFTTTDQGDGKCLSTREDPCLVSLPGWINIT